MGDADGWSEGQDGSQPRYRERLFPSVAIFILVIGLAGVVGVAYGAAYGATLGWTMGTVLGVLGVTTLVATSTPLRVDDRVVRAGRARLPLTAISSARALDPEEMRHARRFGDPRDYLVLRAWSTRHGVAIDVTDPRDPHPRWVISTRHPDRLAAAITAAVASASTASDPSTGSDG